MPIISTQAQLTRALEWNVVARRWAAGGHVLFGVVVLRCVAARRHRRRCCAPRPPPPPPPPPPSREPSICIRSPTTLSFECFWPSFSQRSSLSRPSISTGEPLLRYSLAISAVRPQSVMSTNVVSSTHWSPRLHAIVHGQADIRHGRAAGDVAQLGVAGQIADQDDAVEAGHGYSLFTLSEASRELTTRSAKRLLNTRSVPGNYQIAPNQGNDTESPTQTRLKRRFRARRLGRGNRVDPHRQLTLRNRALRSRARDSARPRPPELGGGAGPALACSSTASTMCG